MSLASCPECWDDQCSCGYQYRHKSNQELYSLISNLIGQLTVRESKDLNGILKQIEDHCRNEANIN